MTTADASENKCLSTSDDENNATMEMQSDFRDTILKILYTKEINYSKCLFKKNTFYFILKIFNMTTIYLYIIYIYIEKRL